MTLPPDQFDYSNHREFGNENINQPVPRRVWPKVVLTVVIIIVILLGLYGLYIYSLVRKIQRGELGVTQLPESSQLAAPKPGFAALSPISDDDPTFGNPDASVTIVEFGDFECPFCKQAYPIVRQILAKYSDQIYFIYRDFPISTVHPYAQKASEAAECAHDQGKFWVYHDKLYQNQDALTVVDLKRYALEVGLNTRVFNLCLDSNEKADEVQDDFREGVAAGVRGTPTFFINGQKITGVIPLGVWEDIINQSLGLQ